MKKELAEDHAEILKLKKENRDAHDLSGQADRQVFKLSKQLMVIFSLIHLFDHISSCNFQEILLSMHRLSFLENLCSEEMRICAGKED